MRDEIDILRREAETSLRVMYSLLQYRKALTSPSDVKSVNMNVHFWRLYDDAFESQMFIDIRRLYENKRDTFNVQTFIKKCRDSIDLFSKDALRKRKLSSGQVAHSRIDSYMLEAYEPSTDDFDSLSALIRKNSKNIKNRSVRAASKIYAHAVYTDHEKINATLSGLEFEEIELALTSIWHVYEQVWQLYDNGREPKLEIAQYPYKEEVFKAVLDQVRALT